MAKVFKLPPINPTELQQSGDDSILLCKSLKDLTSYAQQGNWKACNSDTHSGWAMNGESAETIFNKAVHGDMAAAKRASKMLDKFNKDLEFKSFAWKSVNSVVGGAVNIGAFCAGVPQCMRQRRRIATETAPLSIVVDICASSSTSSSTIETRGVAVLALIQRLSNLRPVQLYIATAHHSPNGGNVGILIKMPSHIDLAKVGNAMASTGFMRYLCFCVENSIKAFGTGAKPWQSHPKYRKHGAAFWRRLSGNEETLFVPPLMGNEEITSRPYEWVESMLKQYGGMVTA
jgi:hypothetical protein